MPQIFLYSLKKFCSVMVASVCVSSLIAHAFFGLDGLVQAVAPLPAGHFAAGEFVDDDHFAVFDDVVHIALVQMMGLERVIDQMRPIHVAGRVEAFHARQLLGRPHAFVGEHHGVLFFFDLEVDVFGELPGELVGLGVFGDIVVRRTGDDQRRAGFVDQNVVDLVDDREVQRPLRLLRAFSGNDDRRARRTACCRAGSRSQIRCWCRR